MVCRYCSLIHPSTAHYTLSAPPVQGVAWEMWEWECCLGRGERARVIASLSRPMPVAGAFLEALSLLRSISLPLVRAQGAHGKTASHQPKAKPLKNHSRGADGLHTVQLRAIEEPFAGGAALVAANPGFALLLLRLCNEWQSHRFANGRARSSFAGRAPCAPPRQSNG